MTNRAPEEVWGWLDELRQAVVDAVADGDFSRAARLDETIRMLDDWSEQGMQDEIPLDVATVLVSKE